MNNIPVIDMVFIVLIFLMLIHGYLKGFIAELFSWASLVLSLFAAIVLYPFGAELIRRKIFENVRIIPEILSFIIIFLIVTLFIKMLEHVLKDVVAGAKLGGVNKFLGAIFGLAEGIAVTAIILFILTIQPFFDPMKIIGDSFFAHILLPLIQIPFNRSRQEMTNVVNILISGIRYMV